MENIALTAFDILNFGLLIFFWRFTLKHYKTLPEEIPVHFDFYGKADHFGSKKYSFFMPSVITFLWGVLTSLMRYVKAANFPVEIAEQNKDVQFLIMEVFVRWIVTLVILIGMNLQDYMFRYTFDENVKPRVPFGGAILAIFGSLITVFIFIGLFK
ncbi:MAG: DUF1648 domain-containing protein [Chryseobacterium sp.]|jgi:uncharacterized membrane protein|uniref:DUF1648 domain-containing protein n=1 Tax=Chryseobacterium sp. TaxID=1871047 RepID=UPI00282C4645|nr:DUF1648 domain-containing protein [Chryseobacterium sp.]MDR2236796.1 DUF1648 domain-containing protein [Chryseobacterium sp.]